MQSNRQTRLRRHLFYAMIITLLAIFAGYKGVLPVFRSHLMEYLGIGDARFGFLFSIGSLAGLSSVLFGGQLLDLWGPRRVIRICLIGIGCAMLVVAFCGRHFIGFALATGMNGVFAASLSIAVNAYLARLFPGYQRRIISLNLASSSVGGMMFPIVAEGLLFLSREYPHISFGNVLHTPFVLAGMVMVGASFIYRPQQSSNGAGRVQALRAGGLPANPHHGSRRWHWRDLLLPRHMFFLAFLIALHGMSDSLLHIWMPRFLESASFPAQIFSPGLVLSSYSLAYLLSRVTLAMLPDNVGYRTFLVFPGLVGGGLIIAGILSRNFVLTAASYVLGGFFWSFEYPMLVAVMLRNGKQQFGAAMAAAGVISYLLMFTGMNLTGMLLEYMGSGNMWKVMPVLAIGFPLAGVGGFIWTKLYGRTRE